MQERLTYEDNAALNRIWYKGEAEELSDIYRQLGGTGFWAMSSHSKVQRIHTGLPGEIADTLAHIVAADMLAAQITGYKPLEDALAKILNENSFPGVLEDAVTQVLVVGDGAFRLNFDKAVSGMPLIKFVPGDRVFYTVHAGRITETIFCTHYKDRHRDYVLREYYGAGYVRYVLTDSDGVPQPLDILPETEGLVDLDFDANICLAVPLRFDRSKRWSGRGRSIFDRKRGSFDALDEAWSQWMGFSFKSIEKIFIAVLSLATEDDPEKVEERFQKGLSQ